MVSLFVIVPSLINYFNLFLLTGFKNGKTENINDSMDGDEDMGKLNLII